MEALMSWETVFIITTVIGMLGWNYSIRELQKLRSAFELQDVLMGHIITLCEFYRAHAVFPDESTAEEDTAAQQDAA